MVLEGLVSSVDTLMNGANGGSASGFEESNDGTTGWLFVSWNRGWYEALEEKTVVTLSLLILSFLFLVPSGHRRRRSKTDKQEPSKQQQQQQQPNNTQTVSSRVPPTPQPTEEETFQQLYPTIRMSSYHRLVLPPECKLVDIPINLLQRHQGGGLHKDESAVRTSVKLRSTLDDDDNPAQRLWNYIKQFLGLLKYFATYDFGGAMWLMLNWVRSWIRFRRNKEKGPVPETEEEDDEVSYVGTAPSNPTAAVPSTSVLFSPLRTASSLEEDHDDMVGKIYMGAEEKKDEDLRRSGATLYYEVPVMDECENDVMEEILSQPQQTFLPQPVRRSLWRTSNSKRRDALDSYRSSFPKAAPPSSPRTVSPVPGEGLPLRSNPDNNLSFFDAAHSVSSLERLHIEVPVPDRNGYIVGDEFLPDSKHTPLLVFVNSRSGPQQGHLLISQLKRLLNPIQVWDLASGGPERVLESFSVMSRVRVLVCGGDGTVSWIISTMEKLKLEKWPPIAVLPLGTGNDLARIHGWGGGYVNESLIGILEQISEAYISLLDRWELQISNKKGKVKDSKSFFNYLGVGVDAQAALQVHKLRESSPKLFFSRVVNKVWYALFGAEDFIKESHANLPHDISLIADGVEVPLPEDSQGIIVLNIDSYSGGVPIWANGVKEDPNYYLDQSIDILDGSRSRRSPRRVQSLGSIRQKSFDRVDSIEDMTTFPLTEEEKMAYVTACEKPSSCQDGVLDIVSVRGTFHLGQIRVGLGNAQRLCQAREVSIVIKKKVAVQIDGEPWRQGACSLKITRKKDPAVMLHRSPDESGGVEQEMSKLLDWAEEKKIINRDVHNTLQKEFSRRIERKTQQRRVKSQDNLMLSLKRAIGAKAASTK